MNSLDWDTLSKKECSDALYQIGGALRRMGDIPKALEVERIAGELYEGKIKRAFRVLKDVSPRRKQVYTMIGHEPFEVCMGRIRKVIDSGGEPYAQPFIKLNALERKPAIRHDWTPDLLRKVQRWVNGRYWKYAPFDTYNPSARTGR